MKSTEYLLLPAASPGTKRSVQINRYGTQGARPKVYIQAGLHADEAPGFVVLHQLIQLLDQADEQDMITGEIVVVPVANPIGLSQWRDESLQGRFDCVNSINFNRRHLDLAQEIGAEIGEKLGTDPQANISLIRSCTRRLIEATQPEDEAASLKCQLLKRSHDADIVLDLHCDLQALMHVYLGTAHWPEYSDLCAFLESEVTLLASDSGGTPFDEANSRLWWDLAEMFPNATIPPACFAATVELRGQSDTNRDTAARDSRNLFSFLQHRGIIGGQAPEVPSLVNDATPLTGVDYIKATVPGIVTYLRQPGDFVNKGDVIAEILNPLAAEGENAITSIKTVTTGLLFSRNIDRFARPGRIIAKVAGSEPLREPNGNLLTL